MSRRIGHITIALATLVLSGCGADNPAPPPLPTASQSASPTAATPPVMPDSARGTTRAAAKEFVRYYVDVLNDAASTGETTQLRELAHPDCKVCRGFSRYIEKVYALGGEIAGNGWVIQRLTVVGRGPEGTMAVRASVTVSSQRVVPSAGASPSNFSGSPDQDKVFSLVSSEGLWSVVDIETVP